MACTLVYGFSVYQQGLERDRNLAYMAMFTDDLAAQFIELNAYYGAVA